MYYLLGHRLVAQKMPDARRKQIIADNTFLLTLDGDVDFQPSAVQLLVDRMKKNDKVGAACGRIHPVGTGECCVGVDVFAGVHGVGGGDGDGGGGGDGGGDGKMNDKVGAAGGCINPVGTGGCCVGVGVVVNAVVVGGGADKKKGRVS